MQACHASCCGDHKHRPEAKVSTENYYNLSHYAGYKNELETDIVDNIYEDSAPFSSDC